MYRSKTINKLKDPSKNTGKEYPAIYERKVQHDKVFTVGMNDWLNI